MKKILFDGQRQLRIIKGHLIQQQKHVLDNMGDTSIKLRNVKIK